MDIIKEACVGSYMEAKRAYEKGAHRIELCDNLAQGGTTPSYGTIMLAVENFDIDIFPIIRPRGGDFVYSEEEVKIMEKDIEVCKDLRVDGVVLGALTKDNELDLPTLKRLIKKAQGLSITFHMAFDRVRDRKEALDKLVELGVDRILTKGGQDSALKNMDKIKELVTYGGDRITILAGGGVTKDNYQKLVNYTKVKEVHGTRIV